MALNLLLQLPELLGCYRTLRQIAFAFAFRHGLDELRIAEVEAGMGSHRRIPQHPIVDLKRHDRVAWLETPNPVVAWLVRHRVLGRHPAVAFPQQADEEWQATLDFIQ